MSEQPTHQDPAEPKEVGTEQETADQPEPVDPGAAVEVSPEEPTQD